MSHLSTSCARTQHICLGIIVCARTQHSSDLLARLQLSVTRRRRRWCRRAAVLDLKMGTNTYAPDATAEKLARRLPGPWDVCVAVVADVELAVDIAVPGIFKAWDSFWIW